MVFLETSSASNYYPDKEIIYLKSVTTLLTNKLQIKTDQGFPKRCYIRGGVSVGAVGAIAPTVLEEIAVGA